MNLVEAIFLCVCLISLVTIVQSRPKRPPKGPDEKTIKYLTRTGAKFLSEIEAREGIIKLKSGLLIEVLKSSDKPSAKSPLVNDNCEVTYKGTLKDGTQFDAGTTSFAPNQVIKGWTEALQVSAV